MIPSNVDAFLAGILPLLRGGGAGAFPTGNNRRIRASYLMEGRSNGGERAGQGCAARGLSRFGCAGDSGAAGGHLGYKEWDQTATWRRLLALSLRPEHLKRYKEIARLLIKYGHGDWLAGAGIEDALGEEEWAEGGEVA